MFLLNKFFVHTSNNCFKLMCPLVNYSRCFKVRSLSFNTQHFIAPKILGLSEFTIKPLASASSTSCFLLPTNVHNASVIRHYAKKKDKGGKSGKNKVIDISLDEMNEVIDAEALLSDYKEAIELLKEEFIKNISIRTNVGSIEELPVEVDGDTYPLNEVAEIHRKSAQLIIIDCAGFPQYAKSIFDAINKSGMNLNPQQEGVRIAVPIPKVTKEHRENLSGQAKTLCNRCKDSIRLVHNNYARKARDREGNFSEDLQFKVIQKIKEYQDNYIKEAEAMLVTKQQELLKA